MPMQGIDGEKATLHQSIFNTTWFQKPIRFEDAFGRVVPVPVTSAKSHVECRQVGNREGCGSMGMGQRVGPLLNSCITALRYAFETREPLLDFRLVLLDRTAVMRRTGG